MGLFSLTQELAIDLGTANTLIIHNGKVVVDEPSIVALDVHTGKLVAIGLATNYFMYVFINISMVLGLIPVVGIPLPLISYGGTVMLSIMASFGIILSVHINRNVQIGKD